METQNLTLNHWLDAKRHLCNSVCVYDPRLLCNWLFGILGDRDNRLLPSLLPSRTLLCCYLGYSCLSTQAIASCPVWILSIFHQNHLAPLAKMVSMTNWRSQQDLSVSPEAVLSIPQTDTDNGHELLHPTNLWYLVVALLLQWAPMET
jgi:hypothetical protein